MACLASSHCNDANLPCSKDRALVLFVQPKLKADSKLRNAKSPGSKKEAVELLM